MWKRKELKEKAKKVIKKNYWTIVIVCFIVAICTSEYGMSTVSMERNFESIDITANVDDEQEENSEDEVYVRINTTEKHSELTRNMAKGAEKMINATINSAVKSQKYIYKIIDGTRLFIQNSKQEAIILFIGGSLAFLFILFIADP